MKRVMIYAYTQLNLGDDLFIKILCDRYPNTQFILQGKGYKNKFKHIVNLKCYEAEILCIRVINKVFRMIGLGKIQLLRIQEKVLIRNIDAAVYIGGSIFIQNEEWDRDLDLFNKRVVKKYPFYFIGCNFGPYSLEEFYKGYRELFSRCKDVCFREKYSYDLFKDMSNIRKADDVVFGLKSSTLSKGNNIVISVINLEERKNLSIYDREYVLKIAHLCKHILDQGDQVTLMSFCKAEGDERAINKILDVLNEEYRTKVVVNCYNGDIEEALKVLGSSKLIVGTRFHAMILGFTLGVPVFPIIYSDKMKNVLEDIDFTGKSVRVEEIGSIDIEEIYNSIFTNWIDVSKQKQEAEKQFMALDELLKG